MFGFLVKNNGNKFDSFYLDREENPPVTNLAISQIKPKKPNQPGIK